MQYSTKRLKKSFRLYLKQENETDYFGFVGHSGSDLAEPMTTPLFLCHDLLEHDFGHVDNGQAKYEYIATGFTMYNTEHLGSYMASQMNSRSEDIQSFAYVAAGVVRFCDANRTKIYERVPDYRLTGFLKEYRDDFRELEIKTFHALEAEFDQDEWERITAQNPHTMREHARYCIYWIVQGMRRARKKWNMYGLSQDMLANMYATICEKWHHMLGAPDYRPHYRGYKESEWRKNCFDSLQNLGQELWQYRDFYLHVSFDGDNVKMEFRYTEERFEDY